MLTAEELLGGAELTYEVTIPPEILRPGERGPRDAGSVRLRPLRVGDLQRIARAAKENDQLLATLMLHQSLVEPAMSLAQVAALHVGVVQYLLDQVNRISGINATPESLASLAQAPLARAAHILAREYGWTPHEVNELTLGQVLLHLQMLVEGQA